MNAAYQYQYTSCPEQLNKPNELNEPNEHDNTVSRVQ